MNGRKVPGAGQAVLLRNDGHHDLLAINLEFARADEARGGSLLKQPSISTTYPVTLLAAASYDVRSVDLDEALNVRGRVSEWPQASWTTALPSRTIDPMELLANRSVGRSRALGLTAISLGFLMITLDATIVNVA